MYCRNCGKELVANYNVCPYCGTPVNNVFKIVEDSNQHYYEEEDEPVKECKPFSKCSLLGLIFGITGVLTIPGLVLSIVGLVETCRREKRGKPLAIVGLVVSSLACLYMILILYFVVFGNKIS